MDKFLSSGIMKKTTFMTDDSWPRIKIILARTKWTKAGPLEPLLIGI